jgi:ABC-type sugar transport system substrate-binding protein
MGYSHFAEHLLTINTLRGRSYVEALPCHSSFGSHVVYGDGRSLTVGFSQVGSESGWRAAETNVAKSEAQKRGTLKIADGQQKQENQIKAVRSFIAQGVDAIFIAPVVATGWEPS